MTRQTLSLNGSSTIIPINCGVTLIFAMEVQIVKGLVKKSQLDNACQWIQPIKYLDMLTLTNLDKLAGVSSKLP